MNSTVGLSNVTMTDDEDDDDVSPTILYLFVIYYGLVFVSGLIGNFVIIMSVYKYKRMRTVVNLCLVNLALADLLFVVLSIFDSIAFLYGKWLLGDAMCRIQSTLIELSYTVSVCTLTLVAFERYISICFPHKRKRTLKQALQVCGLVWLFGLLFCACLFYGYSVRPEPEGKRTLQCRNDYWSNTSRLLFYVAHSIVVYLVPLAIMVFSHVKISKALFEQKKKTDSGLSHETFSSSCDANKILENDMNTNKKRGGTLKQKIAVKLSCGSSSKPGSDSRNKQKTLRRRTKVVRLLVVVTIIFFILWTPFVFVRLLKYIGVNVHDMVWRATQLLIFGNTAINCFIYALMSPAFKTAFKGLFTCNKTFGATMNGGSISRSFDLSDTLKRQSTVARSAIYNVK